jgi:hypothetical protein
LDKTSNVIDRDRIFSTVPPGHALRKLEPGARKSIALATVSAVLQAIEQQAREPDAWEGAKLLDAIQALNRGQPFDALGACAEALSVADERGAGAWARQPDTATLHQLRRALAYTAAAALPPP